MVYFLMFKFISIKTNLYKLLISKKINIKNFEKYDIMCYLLQTKKKIKIGNIYFFFNKNYIIQLNKPIFSFNITRYPKSYPFKEIRS